jgi:hypothetical protein
MSESHVFGKILKSVSHARACYDTLPALTGKHSPYPAVLYRRPQCRLGRAKGSELRAALKIKLRPLPGNLGFGTLLIRIFPISGYRGEVMHRLGDYKVTLLIGRIVI